MGRIPQGYIDDALETVRKEMRDHFRSGTLMDKEYYVSVAEMMVWSSYVEATNSDTKSGICLRYLDIKYGCRTRGIEFSEDEAGIRIFMPEHDFVFSNVTVYGAPVPDGVVGGPCDNDGRACGTLYAWPPEFSVKAFFKLLFKVDTVLDSLRQPVLEYIEKVYLQLKTEEIAGATIQSLFEPGMEDICYRYTIKSGSDGETVGVWLFYDGGVPEGYEDLFIHFSFKLEYFMERMDQIKRILRSVAEDITKWESCTYIYNVEAQNLYNADHPDQPAEGAQKFF